MTIPLKAQNDNKPPRASEKLISSTLANRVVIEEHLRTGLQAMLKSNGVSTAVRDAVSEFIQPAISILDRMEAEVIDYARATPRPEILALFCDAFDRHATTPGQMKVAAHFREYVTQPEVEPVVSTLVVQPPREPPKPANDWKRRGKGKDGPEMEP